MTDIHSHILFDVDDGCFSPETSIQVLKEEEAGGVKDIFLTPHTDNFDADPEKIRNNFQILKKLAEKENINIRLHLGAEVSPELTPDAFMSKGINIQMGENGKYVLLGPVFEPVFSQNSFNKVVYDIQIKGMIPIIAHPERMAYFREKPEILLGFLHGGCLLQINGPSLYGKYGEAAKEFAEKIMKLNWVSFAGSDSHRIHGYSVLEKTYQTIKENYGEEKAKDLLIRNPKNILENRAMCNYDFKEWQEEPKKKKSIFASFFEKKKK